MEKSKVYFTDFRARTGEGLPAKLKRLMKKAGFASMDMEGKFVAIKMLWRAGKYQLFAAQLRQGGGRHGKGGGRNPLPDRLQYPVSGQP